MKRIVLTMCCCFNAS